jgi:hypothetical protein
VAYAASADRSRFEALLLAALRTGAPRAEPFNPVGTIEVVLGDGICDVTAPAPLPRGLVAIRLTTTVGPSQALLFGLGGLTWAQLEAFVADPDFEHPPEVEQLGSPSLAAPGSTTAYANVTGGPVGIVCLAGEFAAPTVQLRGPYEVAP